MPQSNGELVNPNSGKCLDDTGFGGSGTQVQIWACADTSNQQWTLPSGAPPTGNTPNLGPNVYVFNTSMPTATIQNDINQVYATQQSNQFGTQRYELMFEPGTYNVSVPVGFYTEVVGLGQNPSQTVITGGGIYANAAWNGGNATENFWRGVENITIDPSSGSTEWAVSQADPMRRVNIDGNLVLDDDTSGNTTSNWSSGGFISDSVVTGQVNSGTQQQFLMRNDKLGSWTGSNWNMVFVGSTGVPAPELPEPAGHDGEPDPDGRREAVPVHRLLRELGRVRALEPDELAGRLLGEREHAGNLAAAERFLHRDAQQHGRPDQRRAGGRAGPAVHPRRLPDQRHHQRHQPRHRRARPRPGHPGVQRRRRDPANR